MICGMDDKLIIDASRVDAEGEEIEGEVECVDLDEEFVKPFGGVRYRLNLQVFGTELLVRRHMVFVDSRPASSATATERKSAA